MKKSFKVLAAQLERIYKLYLSGYGTKALMDKAESFMFRQSNVGLLF